jgi:uncharacterized membrane protein YsdA (DUF1294 family)
MNDINGTNNISKMSLLSAVAFILRYVFVVNAVGFAIFAWDKRQAKEKRWRVAESKLLLVALLGGTPAAFVACRLFRHKTRKPNFMNRLRAVAVLQVLALVWILVRGLR